MVYDRQLGFSIGVAGIIAGSCALAGLALVVCWKVRAASRLSRLQPCAPLTLPVARCPVPVPRACSSDPSLDPSLLIPSLDPSLDPQP